jgi:pimeloyl-ACP methyl ester carboxylesterase
MRQLLKVLAGLSLLASSGCILGNRPQFVRGGSVQTVKTYYLDGAGNYGFGKETVPLGLEDGGYQGQIEHFIWTTYLGPVLDQMSYSHNRRQGKRLAARIQGFLDSNPEAEVNLIGLSAGSGVAVFALESLPPKYRVNNVIMLSSSLSATYDLTRALRRVRGGMYFFWSPNDPILRGVVPLVGTVDRENTSQVAGVIGARPPAGADKESRQVYAQHIHNIRWYTNEIGGPIKLQHAGTTDRGFIREMVAPILVSRTAMLAGPKPPASPARTQRTPSPRAASPTPPPSTPRAVSATSPPPSRPASRPALQPVAPREQPRTPTSRPLVY